MPGVSIDLVCHRLDVRPEARPVQQKKRKIATLLREPIRDEVQKLLQAKFIRKIQYPD